MLRARSFLVAPVARVVAPVVALVVALVAALALSGCGAGNAIDPVAKAADTSAATPGFRMIFSMQVQSSALPTAVNVTGSGSFNPAARAGSFALKMAAPGAPGLAQVFGPGGLSMQEVLKGTTVYVKLPPALTARIPGASGKSWIRVDLSKLGGAQGSALGSLAANPVSGDPSQLLQYLRGSGGVTKVGTEQVTGRSTTHYRGHVDLSQAASRAPAASRKAVQRAISLLESEGFSKQIPVDVWIDGQGLVRQMRMRMSGAPGGQSVATTVQVTIPQYGRQSAPSVPPAGQILDTSGAAAL